MDSSINTAKPYKEKAPPRRRAPVRNPRPKKDPEPVITSLITGSERAKIRSGQAKLIAETEKASAIAIQNAIRSNLSRKMVKTMRSSTTKVKNQIVPKKPKNEIVPKKIKNEIVPKASTPATAKPKKERKARVPRTPKPVYKMSYTAALKEWNMNHNTGMYCNPRKGSDEYKAVQALRL
jgi:hypothetical protein